MYTFPGPAALCSRLQAGQPLPPRQLPLSNLHNFRQLRHIKGQPQQNTRNWHCGTITTPPRSWHSERCSAASSTQCCSALHKVTEAPHNTTNHSTIGGHQLLEDDSEVLLAGPAAAAGRLPDVLVATFPARFSTMTSARKGEPALPSVHNCSN